MQEEWQQGAALATTFATATLALLFFANLVPCWRAPRPARTVAQRPLDKFSSFLGAPDGSSFVALGARRFEF